jgi:hypothetical protein
MIGKVLGHYLILKKFRADGTVEVYLAQDTTLGRLVTLKFFPPEPSKGVEIRKRFLDDARSTKSARSKAGTSSPWSMWMAKR